MAAPRVKSSVAPNHQRRARSWTGRKLKVFQVFSMTRPGIEPSLSALEARVQPTDTRADTYNQWKTKTRPTQSFLSSTPCDVIAILHSFGRIG